MWGQVVAWQSQLELSSEVPFFGFWWQRETCSHNTGDPQGKCEQAEAYHSWNCLLAHKRKVMHWWKVLESLQFISFPTPVLEWHKTLKTRILSRPGCLCIMCIPCSWESSPHSLLPVPMGQHFRKQGCGNLAGYLSYPPLWCYFHPALWPWRWVLQLRHPQAMQSWEGHPASHASALHKMLSWKRQRGSEKPRLCQRHCPTPSTPSFASPVS